MAILVPWARAHGYIMSPLRGCWTLIANLLLPVFRLGLMGKLRFRFHGLTPASTSGSQNMRRQKNLHVRFMSPLWGDVFTLECRQDARCDFAIDWKFAQCRIFRLHQSTMQGHVSGLLRCKLSAADLTCISSATLQD